MSKEEKKPTEKAVPENINEQTTDGINNLMDVPEHPALVAGNFYQSASHSTGILHQNAVSNYNQHNMLIQAAANQGVMQIYSLDTVSNASAAEPIHDEHQHHDKDKK